MGDVMMAVRLHDYQGIESLRYESTPRPVLAADELLIKVEAAAVNPVDWKIAEGYGSDIWKHHLPITLGCECSGVVVEAGSTAARQVGEEVFSLVDLTRCGAFAEFVVARSNEVAAKPESMSHRQAAAVPVAALTSWQALFETAGLSEGQSVLIHAAAGGVGSVAVQLAKSRGARVIGTASGANEAFVRQLGADRFVDYRSKRFEQVVAEVDVVYDTIGGQTQRRSFEVLKPGGFLVSIVGPADEALAEQHGVRCGFAAVVPNSEQLAKVAELVQAGAIKTEIAASLPLAEAKQALARNREGHTRGKLILHP